MATGLHVTAQLLVLLLCVTRGLTFYFNYIDVKMESYRSGNITVEMSCFKDNYIQEYFLLYHYPGHVKMCKIRPENVTDLEIPDTFPLCSYETQCTLDIASLMDWISCRCPVKCFWDWTNHKACFSEWYTIQYACEQIDKDECGDNSKYCWRRGKCSLADNRGITCDCNEGFTGSRCQNVILAHRQKRELDSKPRTKAGKILYDLYGTYFDETSETVKNLVIVFHILVCIAVIVGCAFLPKFLIWIYNESKHWKICTTSVPDDRDASTQSDSSNLSDIFNLLLRTSGPTTSPPASSSSGPLSGKKEPYVSDKDKEEAGTSSGTRATDKDKQRVLDGLSLSSDESEDYVRKPINERYRSTKF